MADHFTHFSCLLDMRTPENAARALELYNDQPEDEDGLRLSDGFLLSLEGGSGTELWIYDDGSGDPERVIEFVLLCAETFDLKGLWVSNTPTPAPDLGSTPSVAAPTSSTSGTASPSAG